MLKKVVGVLCLSSFLVGCGSVANTVVSNQGLKKNAAITLKTTADKIQISGRQSETLGNGLFFTATTEGKSYQCYMTSMFGLINSNAICDGVDGQTVEDPCRGVVIIPTERCPVSDIRVDENPQR